MDPLDFESIWQPLRERVQEYRRAVDELPTIPNASDASIQAHLSEHFAFDRPFPIDDLIGETARMLSEWNLHTPSPRYFGLFNPDVMPASVAADALAAAFNPQLAAWTHSPAANSIEQHTLSFFKSLLGFEPATSSACFASGGMEANHSAMIVALTHLFPAYAERGVRSLPGAPLIYVSREVHHSFLKIAHACGLGRVAVREIDVDDRLRISVDALTQRIERDSLAGMEPAIVVATAGTTGAGAIDPIDELATFCESRGLWLHVDAAWGGAALLSDQLRHHLEGIARADSVTFDAHKWLSVPMGAGMFFCRHRESVQRAFGADTSYMPAKAASPDPYQTTLQWSRRTIGLKVFMALASLGKDGYATVIEHQSEMGRYLREKLISGGWEIVNDSPFPIVCFRHPSCGDSRQIVDLVLASRRAWVSDVELSGKGRVIRACITNYRTHKQHVDELVELLEQAVAAGTRESHIP